MRWFAGAVNNPLIVKTKSRSEKRRTNAVTSPITDSGRSLDTRNL